jgi:hypothetical protein
LYNNKNHLSTEEQHLIECCKVWLEMMRDHWWKNGYNIDWLTDTQESNRRIVYEKKKLAPIPYLL